MSKQMQNDLSGRKMGGQHVDKICALLGCNCSGTADCDAKRSFFTFSVTRWKNTTVLTTRNEVQRNHELSRLPARTPLFCSARVALTELNVVSGAVFTSYLFFEGIIVCLEESTLTDALNLHTFWDYHLHRNPKEPVRCEQRVKTRFR